MQQYEVLYWSMACVVATALAGGAACSRLPSLRGSFFGTLALSALVLAAGLGVLLGIVAALNRNRPA